MVDFLTKPPASPIPTVFWKSIVEQVFLTQELKQRLSVDHWTTNDPVTESRAHISPILNTCAWEFLPGTIETQQLPGKYDLIASASAIQWIADTLAFVKTPLGSVRKLLMHLRNTGVNANVQPMVTSAIGRV